MSDRILVATRKGLFRIDRGSRGWGIQQVWFVGDELSLCLPDQRDGTLYAAFKHGHFGSKLHRSRNSGDSWEECGTPAFPEMPEGEEETPAHSGRPLTWNLDTIWELSAGGPGEDGVIWCGTIPGGLFRSEDHGTSWQLIESLWFNPKRKEWFGGGADLPGIHSVCVDPRDSKRVVVGISCGGVWVTTDGGASWTLQADGMRAEFMPPDQQGNPNIQDPHRVVQCHGAPDTYWAQHHNGIFKTINGCESWSEIETAKPSAFGFGVAVHPQDPDTAWFVPAIKDEKRVPVAGAVVVSRTRDGGRTFEVLREGLPQEHAYDLTLRHALDIDGSGDRLAFGSSTGSLWVTENQGDSWQCVSQHLPPIYCVRFIRG